MVAWRITKYDPKCRDNRGAYLRNEWTFYYDLGKSFDGKEFRINEYLKIENAYIHAIVLFMECLNVNSLKITDLEQSGIRPEKILAMGGFDCITNNGYVAKDQIAALVKLILRNVIWCKLESNGMYVHFAYDYYMYIGSEKLCESALKKIERMELYVEKYESPYNEED